MGVQISPSHIKSSISDIYVVALGTASYRKGIPRVSQSFQAWVYLA